MISFKSWLENKFVTSYHYVGTCVNFFDDNGEAS